MGRQLSRRWSLKKQIPICYHIIYLLEKDHSATPFPRSGFQAWLSVASVVMPPWCSHGRTGGPQWGPERVRVEGCVARASSWNQPPRPIRMKEQLRGSHGFVMPTPGLSVTFPSKELSSGQCSFLTLNLQLTWTLLTADFVHWLRPWARSTKWLRNENEALRLHKIKKPASMELKYRTSPFFTICLSIHHCVFPPILVYFMQF